MNNLRNEEKKFKSYLKKKVSFDLQILVKFLITGVIAVSVTACGGGGGGGSSSSVNGNDTHTVTQTPASGKEYTTDKNISIASTNAIGIIGKNSDITNTKTIRISNQYGKINNLNTESIILAIIKELGMGAGIFGEGGTLTNKGNIILSGNNAIGIIGAYSKIVNENNIKTEGTTKNMIGILSLGSNVTNNGTIDINSLEGTGIYVYNDIEVEGITIGNGKTIDITNNKEIKVTGESVEGIYVEGKNVTVINGKEGNITINNIVEGKSEGHNSYGIKGENVENIHIINDGNITLNVDSKLTQTNGKIYKNIGIGVDGNKNSIINNGNISVDISGNPEGVVGIGIASNGNNKIENNGIIDIKGNKVSLPIEENLTLEQLISKISTGISIENATENLIVNSSKGVINISGSGIGIYAKNSKVENQGVISLVKGEFLDSEVPNLGMVINGGEGINNGRIVVGNNYSTGMMAFNGGIITNGEKGEVNLTGNNVEGMSVDTNGIAINKGEIIVEGYKADGIDADSGRGENYGTITVIGEDASGMRADAGGIVINQIGATINVKAGANGMVASGKGSKAENKGTINVYKDAKYGMCAWDGGTIVNNGLIRVEEGHADPDLAGGVVDEFDEEGNPTGSIKEPGKGEVIEGVVDFSIKNGGTYVVGTNSDGTFGKLTASDIDLNGNLVISTDMVKGSYEESYKLDNMIEGENINLGEEYKNISNSLLYDAKTSKDENGNLDGELVRNNNSISDFTSKNLSQVGELFDKYLSKENYEKLSQEDKELVDKIFISTSSANEIKNTMNKLVGLEYLNISRQIFDIKDSFRKYDTSVISTLDRYDYNFTLIGEYGDIQSKDGIVGYDTKMTGFNGAMRLADNLYGTLGYGYSDIDYDNNAECKIQTIHAGIFKDYSYNKSNIRVGTFGEYNFHETDRENLDGNVNTDYNSYLLGVTGEISKKYGNSLYIQPKFALDIAYGNVENFRDQLEIKEQNYTSVLPKVELIVGKKLNNIELFAKSSYSYELGNLDKDMDIKLLNNTVEIDNDTMDKGNLDLSIGTEINFESLSLSAELGKEFGKRDREYIKAGITYKF